MRRFIANPQRKFFFNFYDVVQMRQNDQKLCSFFLLFSRLGYLVHKKMAPTVHPAQLVADKRARPRAPKNINRR
jgi:hypothetical protein